MTEEDDFSGIDSLDEGPEILTPLELYNELLSCEEMILTIPATELDKLRKGLASAKAKQNAKLKDAGLAADNSVLGFIVAESKEHPGAVQVTISLAKRSGITVLNKEYPDKEF